MRALFIYLFCILIQPIAVTEAYADAKEHAYIWSQDPRYHLFKQGQHYRTETEKDLDKSLKYHLKAARADYAASQYAVGWVLGFDKDRDPDYTQSLFWMLKVIAPHETPQVPKYDNLKIEAEKALKKLCNKGVVDFPDSHHLSQNPYCWLKRGERLFYGRDKLGEFFGSHKYGVEQDFIKARYYLEKAYEAGEIKAAINLAKLYENGLGGMTDPVKYQKYLNVAAKLDDAETHLTLAKIAQDENRITEYIQHLNIAAKGRHTTGSKASRALGKIYFEGELMPRDLDKAMMHFFLSGKTRYVKGDKLTFPGLHKDMIAVLRDISALEHIEAGKQAADTFAKTHKLPNYRKQKIERSYGLAIQSFQYVQRTGGHWYKDSGWWLLMMLALIAIGSNSFAASKKKKNTNTSYTDI